MGRGFRIFLVCLLGFCVLFGAFCIIWPLMHDGPQQGPNTVQPNAPVEVDPSDTPNQPEPSQPEDQTPASDPEGPSLEAQKAQAQMEQMSLEEKVYQLFFVTPEALTGVETATRAGDTTRAAIEEQPVGGIVYFAANLIDRNQTMELLSNTQSYSKIPLFLAVDEEGGIVSRVGSNPAMGVTHLDSMASYGAQADPQQVYTLGRTLGEELLALGFNLDFAPVADVVTNPNNTEIGSRSFSSDPFIAAKMVGSMVSGMQESGILSALKHFPGHGGTASDTHNGLSVTTRTPEEMEQSEFLPFAAGIEAGAPFVMVGHLSATAINGDNTPADLSSAIVSDILRGDLGYQGLIITDAQDMGAITSYYTPAEAAVGALEAGVDMILMPADLQAAVDGVLSAIEQGRLTESRIDESVLRILTTKYRYNLFHE